MSKTDPYAYIRGAYKVPARTGARVRFEGKKEGTILRQRGSQSHLAVRFDGETRTARLHPTWEVEYLAAPSPLLQQRGHA